MIITDYNTLNKPSRALLYLYKINLISQKQWIMKIVIQQLYKSSTIITRGKHMIKDLHCCISSHRVSAYSCFDETHPLITAYHLDDSQRTLVQAVLPAGAIYDLILKEWWLWINLYGGSERPGARVCHCFAWSYIVVDGSLGGISKKYIKEKIIDHGILAIYMFAQQQTKNVRKHDIEMRETWDEHLKETPLRVSCRYLPIWDIREACLIPQSGRVLWRRTCQTHSSASYLGELYDIWLRINRRGCKDPRQQNRSNLTMHANTLCMLMLISNSISKSAMHT